MAGETVLECRGIHHWFGENLVLHDVNLRIIRGEIVALVGPSGCGKSTLLRAIIGTHPPNKGAVLVANAPGENGTQSRSGVEAGLREVHAPGRDRGIVYQHYSLFPFLTAQGNVAMGPQLGETSLPHRLFQHFAWRRLRKQQMDAAAELLGRLKLEGAIKRYPHQMSGGMRQRVAIAQALIMKPQILLLDEPFGALDEATREELQRMLLTLYLENLQAKGEGRQPPHTILIVTHELNEAIYVADRIVGLSQYWNWREESFERCPGATIVYDQMAPIYHPEDEKDLAEFAEQRETIRHAAFDPEVLQERDAFHCFWEEVHKGNGKGVLA